MSVTTQLLAASYPSILKDHRGGAFNQWGTNAALRALERLGFIKRQAIGSTIEPPISYQANSTAQVLSSDFADSGLTQTETVAAPSYTPAPVSVSTVWSKADEAKNASPKQKIDLVKQLARDAIDSHDNLLETVVCDTTSNGLLGARSIITEDGTGTVGTIVSGTDTWWKNQFAEYTNGTDLIAKMTAVYVACQRGSGSSMGAEPKLVITNPTSYGLYHGNLVANERYVNADEAAAGFKALGFMGADLIFSSKVDVADEAFYFLSPEAIRFVVSSDYFRHKGEVFELEAKQAFGFKLFSVCQVCPSIRNSLGIAFS